MNDKRPFQLIFVFLLTSFFLISACSESRAQIVRYMDADGKMHTVDMAVKKVPPRYLYQISEQLKAYRLKNEAAQSQPTESQQNIPAPNPLQELINANAGKSSGVRNQLPVEMKPVQTQKEAPVQSTAPVVKRKPVAAKEPRSSVDILGSGNYTLELFTSLNCKKCQELEDKLEDDHVDFSRYDIDYSAYGKQVYQNNGRNLPILRVVSTLIPGYSEIQIDDFIKELDTGYQNPLYR